MKSIEDNSGMFYVKKDNEHDFKNFEAIACEICALEFDCSTDLINHKTIILHEIDTDKTNEFMNTEYDDPDEYYDKISHMNYEQTEKNLIKQCRLQCNSR